jgi:CHRD domain
MNPLIQFKTTIPPLLISVLFVCFGIPAAQSATELFSANLVGENEVPPINTAGSATFRMQIVDSNITFSLSFSDLSSPLAVAHLHFAPTKVAGGVMIFLCGGGGQPACPAATSGSITGTFTAANVVGPLTQGITAGDLDSALEAVRADLAYANMHTSNFPGGEIRGQVRRGDTGP